MSLNTSPISPGRRAKRKLSPKQIAFLKRKARREELNRVEDSRRRLDAWYLNTYHPEIAAAKRAKGVENNAKAWEWRRQSFIDSFAQWPDVLRASDMGYLIRVDWLPSQRKLKWRGCKKHFPNTEASVRKKITKLGVYRYNPSLRVWFKRGVVEAAQSAHQLTEHRCVENGGAKQEQDVQGESGLAPEQNAEVARPQPQSHPARQGWHDFIPHHLKPSARAFFVRRRKLAGSQTLDELPADEVDRFVGKGEQCILDWLQDIYEGDKYKTAEAALIAA